MLTLSQIIFCARECEMQESGEYSVADMCAALIFALDNKNHGVPLSLDLIRAMGRLVEPKKNQNGFRSTPVYFQNDQTKQALAPRQIWRALEMLITQGHNLTPDERYVEFQKIHPFNDGNGRTGAILYNVYWVGGENLEYPAIPPNFF